jgi:hypothetical protein
MNLMYLVQTYPVRLPMLRALVSPLQQVMKPIDWILIKDQHEKHDRQPHNG